MVFIYRTNMKTCTCGVTGEYYFYKNKNTPDGFQYLCKFCIAKERRETYHRKYPEGKNGGNQARFAKLRGNKHALKHGLYSKAGDMTQKLPEVCQNPECKKPLEKFAKYGRDRTKKYCCDACRRMAWRIKRSKGGLIKPKVHNATPTPRRPDTIFHPCVMDFIYR